MQPVLAICSSQVLEDLPVNFRDDDSLPPPQTRADRGKPKSLTLTARPACQTRGQRPDPLGISRFRFAMQESHANDGPD
jgi:hypothetical protein